jgi:RNA polymerase sigma-70 factor (ECF subfamily)
MTDEYIEKDLLERARGGDQPAFETLVKNTDRLVYNLALRMTQNEQDALDVSQEAYLRAWKSLSSFEGNCSFSSWMYRITRNACIDYLKMKKKHSAIRIDAESDDGEKFELPITDEESMQEVIAERNDTASAIRQAIDGLSQLQREIIILSDVEGYSYKEIAQILQVEEGTVKSRLSRAREKLRCVLKKTELF